MSSGPLRQSRDPAGVLDLDDEAEEEVPEEGLGIVQLCEHAGHLATPAAGKPEDVAGT